MLTETFTKKSKSFIRTRLQELGFNDENIQNILNRMEDQARSIENSTTAFFQDFSYEVTYHINKNKTEIIGVDILRKNK